MNMEIPVIIGQKKNSLHILIKIIIQTVTKVETHIKRTLYTKTLVWNKFKIKLDCLYQESTDLCIEHELALPKIKRGKL